MPLRVSFHCSPQDKSRTRGHFPTRPTSSVDEPSATSLPEYCGELSHENRVRVVLLDVETRPYRPRKSVGHARARSSPTSLEMCSRSCSQGERRIVDRKPSVGRSKQTSHQEPEATRRTSTRHGPGTHLTAACSLSSMAALPGCSSGMSLKMTTSLIGELLVTAVSLRRGTGRRYRSQPPFPLQSMSRVASSRRGSKSLEQLCSSS